MDNALMRLGKGPVKVDPRTFQLRALLRPEIPPAPDVWDVDSQFGFTIHNEMLANDKWGCCVIAGRAHQTHRFEAFEQNTYISITDEEVLKEYWKEGRRCAFEKKPDRGLVMLNSLNEWREKGWLTCGHTYKIYAFAQVHPTDMPEIKNAIYYFNGINIGLSLPLSAQSQDVWDIVAGAEGAKGSWGGHCVYLKSYDAQGLTCITWGKPQRMTWSFFWTYCDEAYAVLDNKDYWLGRKSPLDIVKLENLLKGVS